MDYIWVFLILLGRDPHLSAMNDVQMVGQGQKRITFLNVLRPAKIEPPIHVEYFRSGGA